MRALLTLIVMSFCATGACKKGEVAATDAAQSRPAAVALKKNPVVKFETTHGKFVVRLFADKAPLSVANLLQYIETDFYKDTIFHRIIPDFMIQGGGFTKDLQQKPTGSPVKNEADNNLSNKRGTVAMARTSDPNSATSQFFINVHDNVSLDRSPRSAGYTVVGEVIDGMGVIDLIRNLPTRCPSWTGQSCTENITGGLRDVPIEPVVILSAKKQ